MPTLPVVQSDQLASGSIAAATLNSAYTVQLANGEGVVGFNVSGLSAAGAVLTVEAADNSSNWTAIKTLYAGALTSTISSDGNYRVNATGHTAIRLRVSTAASSAANVAIASAASSVSGMVALSSELPAPAYGPTALGAVTTTIAAAGASNPFTPVAGRGGLHWLLSGTALATCAMEQQVAGSWYPITINGQPFGVISYTGSPVNETSQENGFGIPHRLNCGATNVSGAANGSFTSGSLSVTLVQP